MSDKILTAGEIAAFTDAELDRYLDQHRLFNGDPVVRVKDPHNLPESFIQKLRDRASPRQAAVDLDKVNSRLQSLVHPSNRTPSRSPSSSPEPYPEEEKIKDFIEGERKYHDLLVQWGGRPFYPVDKLPDVANNPHKYKSMKDFWHLYGNRPSVFWYQHIDWYDFLNYRHKARLQSTDKLLQYTQDARKRLETRSISRPFQFSPDAAQQDRLTTWLEYLNYVLWEIEHFTRTARPDLVEQCTARLPWFFAQIEPIEADMAPSPPAEIRGCRPKRGLDDDTPSKAPARAKKRKLDRSTEGPELPMLWLRRTRQGTQATRTPATSHRLMTGRTTEPRTGSLWLAREEIPGS